VQRPRRVGRRGRALDHDHAGGAVLSRVQDLVPQLGVVEVLRRAEGRLRVALARLAGHHEDDLASRVQSGVVVVADRRGGDAVARERRVGGDRAVVGKREGQEVRARRERAP
jgi:hypothetical protein